MVCLNNRNGKWWCRLCTFWICKSIENNSLNFNEGISGRDRIVSYSQISPLSISEPMTWEDLDDVFSENEIVIDGNGSRK